MNTTREDENNQKLNLIIKTLGRRGKEGEQWKNADQEYWKFSLNFLSEILSNASSTGSIVLHPYGSAAEDLKSEEADDFGDVDIMMFPTSHNLLIHDELIEYLPQNPLFVRIKGVHHPLLKFCCVEDMDYVSTTAVKDSHDLIYGDIGKSIATTAFEFLSREEPSCPPPFTCCYEDSNDSPAVKFTVLLPPDTDVHSPSRKLQIKKSLLNSSEKTTYVHESETTIDDSKTEQENEDISKNPSGLEGEEQPCTADVTQNPSYCSKDAKAHKTKRMKGVALLCKHMFPNGSAKANLRKNYVEAGIDFVPALKAPGWPKVAEEWIRRERKWPSPEVVGNVIKDGFHLVVKSSKVGGNPNCDFRISFSHAEYLLSKEMNDIQRECYRCLKKYHRAYLSKYPKGLVTFHLKNILFQTIEETGSEVWTESNQALCLMKLLRNLLKALTEKNLPHFFVKSYNMFCVDYIEDPEVLEKLASKVGQIMQNPRQFAKEVIQMENSQDERHVQKERGVGRGREVDSCSKHVTGKQAQKDELIEETPCTDDTLTGPQIKQTKASHEGNSPFAGKRYQDLKVSFLAISNELTDIAFNEHEGVTPLKLLDPLETSLVQDIREIRKQLDFTREEFSKMFELMGTPVLLKLLLSTEAIMKRRVILHGIQSALENFKYVLRHHDDEEGSVKALSLMLDPAAEDPIDLNNIFPAGGGTQLVRMITGNYTPDLKSDKPPVDLNEIPLD